MHKTAAILLIMTLALFITVTHASALPQAADTGTIQGIVTRAGSTEALPEVQIVVLGRGTTPNAGAIQRLVFDATLAGIPLNPGQLTPDTLDLLQTQMDAAAIRGIERVKDFQKVLNDLRGGTSRFVAISDAAGTFTIPNVPAGTYSLRAEREGYFGSTFKGSTPLAVTMNVTVTAKQNSIVQLSMLPGGTISGVIRDENGQPRSKGSVQAFSVTYQNGFPVLAPAVGKVTNDLGEYRLFWLPPGDYYVGATAEPPRTTGGGEAIREAPAVVNYYPSTVDVRAGTLLELKAGDQVEGINVALQRARLPKITGTILARGSMQSITDAQTAVGANPAAPLVTLMMLQRDPNTPDNTTARVVGSANLATGRFEVQNVLPGSYDFYARIEDFDSGVVFLGRAYDWGRAQFVVGDRDVEGIGVSLYPGFSVKGTVTLDNAVPQNPVRISIVPDGTAVKLGAYNALSQNPVQTGPDGSFTIPRIPVGHFRIIAPGLPPQLYIADVRQAVSVFDSGFEIENEEPGAIQVEIKSGAGTIDGAVRGARQEPVAGAIVVAVPAAPSRRSNRVLYKTATSDTTGKFSIPGVAPGEYRVFAWDALSGGAYFNEMFLARYESSGRPASVRQGAATTMDLTVLSGR